MTALLAPHPPMAASSSAARPPRLLIARPLRLAVLVTCRPGRTSSKSCEEEEEPGTAAGEKEEPTARRRGRSCFDGGRGRRSLRELPGIARGGGGADGAMAGEELLRQGVGEELSPRVSRPPRAPAHGSRVPPPAPPPAPPSRTPSLLDLVVPPRPCLACRADGSGDAARDGGPSKCIGGEKKCNFDPLFPPLQNGYSI
ncbi:hypothetical protein PR202_ga13348 [Eleusine coracana subsp. coracana]|uniref:Uncharacterized protein n=1 Tax=Eleusine coracana subsp. coracana TaxID=191504 RepID=A0AAV5CEJ8_ELECO|nr:hypothetical protein PR202_ga13348 [Eleusine coracana subsp. coracana]